MFCALLSTKVRSTITEVAAFEWWAKRFPHCCERTLRWFLQLGKLTGFKISLLAFLMCFFVVGPENSSKHITGLGKCLVFAPGKCSLYIHIMMQSLIGWIPTIFSLLQWKDTGFIQHKDNIPRVGLRMRKICGIFWLQSPSLSNLWSVLWAWLLFVYEITTLYQAKLVLVFNMQK